MLHLGGRKGLEIKAKRERQGGQLLNIFQELKAAKMAAKLEYKIFVCSVEIAGRNKCLVNMHSEWNAKGTGGANPPSTLGGIWLKVLRFCRCLTPESPVGSGSVVGCSPDI